MGYHCGSPSTSGRPRIKIISGFILHVSTYILYLPVDQAATGPDHGMMPLYLADGLHTLISSHGAEDWEVMGS